VEAGLDERDRGLAVAAVGAESVEAKLPPSREIIT